ARDLAPDPVEDLFRAQLRAARGAEEAFLALPPAARPPVPALDLQREARPAIGAISDAIVERASDLAAEPEQLAAVDPAHFAETPAAPPAPLAARLAIGGAVKKLRRDDSTGAPVRRR